MTETTERWLPVVGYAGRYVVSDQGRVRSLVENSGRPRLCPPVKHQRIKTQDNWACYTISLSKCGRTTKHMVHTLVARAFIGARADGLEIRHLNGDPLDNRAVNLAYGTRSENAQDAVLHGTHNFMKANRQWDERPGMAS